MYIANCLDFIDSKMIMCDCTGIECMDIPVELSI